MSGFSNSGPGWPPVARPPTSRPSDTPTPPEVADRGTERREAATIAAYTEWAIGVRGVPTWDDLDESVRVIWRKTWSAGHNRYNNYTWREKRALTEQDDD